MGLPLLSPYLQSVGSGFRHGANFATLASTALQPNTSLFVTGISPFFLAVQLNQMKDLRNKVLTSNGNNGMLLFRFQTVQSCLASVQRDFAEFLKRIFRIIDMNSDGFVSSSNNLICY